MKKISIISILVFTIIILLLNSCTTKHDYFIISKRISAFDKDTMRKVVSNVDSLKNIPPPKSTFKAPINWYTPLVIVLDSTDKVYIYQTETITKSDHQYDDTCPETIKYSNYIGLQPEHLIAFKSNDFIEFIMENHDIFELDTTRNDTTARVITIASNLDTIKNKAFYDLQKLTSMYTVGTRLPGSLFPIKENANTTKSICIIRKTTEEENAVIYHKRKKIKYTPETIKWSCDFINGKCKPFTKEYDSLENEMGTKQKAIFGIKKISRKVGKIM